jgi:hypothetical protein
LPRDTDTTLHCAENIEGNNGNDDANTPYSIEDGGSCFDHACGTVYTWRICGRETLLRVLGPLGADSDGASGAPLPGMGGQGKSRHHDRFHHLQWRQGPVDRGGRVASKSRPRRFAVHQLVRDRSGRKSRTGRRRRGRDHCAERQPQQSRRVSRKIQWPLDRRADRIRQHPVAALRPHRFDAATRRARRDQNVPGGRAARSASDRELDVGLLPRCGREVLQGRIPVRHAAERHPRRGSTGSARCLPPTARG